MSEDSSRVTSLSCEPTPEYDTGAGSAASESAKLTCFGSLKAPS